MSGSRRDDSARTQNALSVAVGLLGIGVTILFPAAWLLGVGCVLAGIVGLVYTWLSHAEDRRQEEQRTRLREQARAIIVSLIGEGMSLHNDPGYYADCSSSLYVSTTVPPATPSADTSPRKEFIEKVERDWRVRFSEQLNACPFKEGTGGVFLDDRGNRLDLALEHLQAMLHHLDEHVDFARCGTVKGNS